MSALAIVCAISPPIVPAPTTAALKTNMSLDSVLRFGVTVGRGGGLAPSLVRVSVACSRAAASSAPNLVSVRVSDVRIARRMKKKSSSGVTIERCLSV